MVSQNVKKERKKFVQYALQCFHYDVDVHHVTSHVDICNLIQGRGNIFLVCRIYGFRILVILHCVCAIGCNITLHAI